MKYLYTLLSVFFIISCSTDWRNYGGYMMESSSKLDYFIVLDKADTIIENGWKGVYINYHKDDTLKTYFLGKGGKIIDSYVDDVCFNEKFIIVSQKPLDSICECNSKCGSNKYENWDKLATYKLCKKALKKSTFHNYWIINKNKNELFGPFTPDKYIEIKNNLKIPENLKLKFEE
jgi:hypothetical protein